MIWGVLHDGPLAVVLRGQFVELHTIGESPDRVWLIRASSPAHAYAGWFYCVTGRGWLSPRLSRPADHPRA